MTPRSRSGVRLELLLLLLLPGCLIVTFHQPLTDCARILGWEVAVSPPGVGSTWIPNVPQVHCGAARSVGLVGLTPTGPLQRYWLRAWDRTGQPTAWSNFVDWR